MSSNQPTDVKSAVMRRYNQLHANGTFDKGRLNRALGLNMRADDTMRRKWAEYNTTRESCDCPDSVYRQVMCKHRLALEMESEIGNQPKESV
jgi:hypothetical protein